MIILGVRASAQEIRYAVLEKESSGNIVFHNQTRENRLKYPANMEKVEEKVRWAKEEFDRIMRQIPNISKIVLKMNEYAGTENGAKRETTYVDAVILLCAAEHGIPIDRKLNSQIGSTSTTARELAERHVGKTSQYWNNTMADAILAAYWEVRK